MQILENTSKVIRLLDKEKQQELLRKIIEKIEVENKHITRVHLIFGGIVELSEESRNIS